MFYWFPDVDESFFCGSADYRRMVCPDAVCESGRRYFPYTERHVQALWFDDSLRPTALKTRMGEPVAVENPGRWNLEAGPDFRGAVLRVGREGRRVAGDAEIHVASNDWKNHGHHTDPRYENVRFHVTWFEGAVDESLFPPGTVHLSLCDCCTTDLESIDLTAYPYGEPRAAQTFQCLEKVRTNVSNVWKTPEWSGCGRRHSAWRGWCRSAVRRRRSMKRVLRRWVIKTIRRRSGSWPVRFRWYRLHNTARTGKQCMPCCWGFPGCFRSRPEPRGVRSRRPIFGCCGTVGGGKSTSGKRFPV